MYDPRVKPAQSPNSVALARIIDRRDVRWRPQAERVS